VRSRTLRLINLVQFDVSNVRYSSLDFALEIAGIKQLLELFNGDLDLFMGFLSAYLPVAFETTFELNDVSNLKFESWPTPDLVRAFGASGALGTVGSPSDRYRSIWLLANGTLIFPVLLSLLILYVAFKGLIDHREQLIGLTRDVSVRERALLDQAGRRISELEQSQIEMTKLLQHCCCTPVARPRKPQPACPPQ
jgi:hypothetical protein